MAEGKIPVRVNGLPTTEVSNVSVQGSRNVNQRATTGGIKQSYGQLKVQVQLTFAIAEQKQEYLLATGAWRKTPVPHNLGFDLGGSSFNCLRGIVNQATAQSDQDANADLQCTVMFEEIEESPS